MATAAVNNRLQEIIADAQEGLHLDTTEFKEKVNRLVEDGNSKDVVTDILIKTALEQIDEANPNWTYFASRIYAAQLYDNAAHNRGYQTENKYGSFYSLIKALT